MQFLLALATLRVATTLLPPEEVGKVSLVLTTTAFFAMFLVNPVGMFINRRLYAWQANGTARGYLEHYTGYLVVVASIAAITLPLVAMIGWVNFGIPLAWLVALVCGSLIFNTINQTSIPSLNMLGDSRSFVVLSVITLAASFVCAVILVETVEASAQYWVLGLLLGQTLLAVVGTKVFFAHLRKAGEKAGEISGVTASLRRKQYRTLFEFAWPVALAAGLGWIQGQGYRYILESHLGLAQLGLFVAGYGISAGLIAGFESVLTTYFQPRLYRDANKGYVDELAAAWQRYASAVIPSLLLTVALIMALAPELTRLFLGERFQTASTFVMWGALAEAARVLTGIYSLIAHVFMRTRWLVLPTAVGAVLAVLASLVLIPRFAAIGAGIGLAFAGFVVVLLMHALLASRAGGGVGARQISKAFVVGAALWLLVLALRVLLGNEGWTALAGIIVMTGCTYLGALYWFLHRHLAD